MKHHRLLEVCVDSIASALAAEAGGAGRLELCSALSEGGLTPGLGLLEVVRDAVSIPIHVLIRPRRGDFLYSDAEFRMMKKAIVAAKEQGARGVVLGMLLPVGHIDHERVQALVALSRPLEVTFHRAFDLCADPFGALDTLVQLGVDRLLTSGQQASGLAGAALIRQLQAQAGNALVVMPGGGIDRKNIAALLKATGAAEYHASARRQRTSAMLYRRETLAMGASQALSEYESLQTDALEVRALVEALRQAPSQCH